MGQEIDTTRFSRHDFDAFAKCLSVETEQLKQLINEQGFSDDEHIVGFEIEAWLVSETGMPTPINHTYLAELNHPLVVHELAAFNIELNSVPVRLTSNMLRNMQQDLQHTWDSCREVAKRLSANVMMTGILPSIETRHLRLEHMSRLNRYRALNEQIIKSREGKPFELKIEGHQHIHVTQKDVMLESACTSLQLHLQMPLARACDALNVSSIVSAPIVAATANSPFLFGRDCWAETRIPLFEQAIDLGENHKQRVSFGEDYVHESIMECFQENIDCYPVLVPITDSDAEETRLHHLRFHNGTIWRWNRPLIGFNGSGKPHLRIEHRVIAAGPTVVDSIANAAFYFGLVNALADDAKSLCHQLSFAQAKYNFYQCAQHGLKANVNWLAQAAVPVTTLILEELLPAAKQGLAKMDVDSDDIDHYLGIIQQRVASGQNGADWQRRWVDAHGIDMQQLSCQMMRRQYEGKPVHQWEL